MGAESICLDALGLMCYNYRKGATKFGICWCRSGEVVEKAGFAPFIARSEAERRLSVDKSSRVAFGGEVLGELGEDSSVLAVTRW